METTKPIEIKNISLPEVTEVPQMPFDAYQNEGIKNQIEQALERVTPSEKKESARVLIQNTLNLIVSGVLIDQVGAQNLASVTANPQMMSPEVRNEVNTAVQNFLLRLPEFIEKGFPSKT